MAGGGGQQNSTVYQSNLPEYAAPYYEAMMDRTLGESERPYQPYQGQRITGMSNPTMTGLDMAQSYAASGPGVLPAAQGNMMSGANTAMGYSGYAPDSITNSYTGPVQGAYDPMNAQSGIGTFDGTYFGGNQVAPGVNQVTSQNFDAGIRDQYMSPYMQAVVDKAKTDTALNFAREKQYRDSEAAAAGAFGGTRSAVREQMAANQMLSTLKDIDVQGAQSAFENAQQQFERDRAAGMNAQQANQQAGLTMQGRNLQNLMDAQQLQEQSRQYGYGNTESAYQKAAELGLQADQAGANFGLEGMKTAGTLSQGASGLEDMWNSMMLDRIRTQLGAGQASEDYLQQSLDQAYNDYVNQRDAERQNLQFLSSILRGVPISANQDVTTSQSTNPLAGILGMLGAQNSISNASG